MDINTPLDQTDLPDRTKNCLIRAGYYSAKDAILTDAWELLQIPNFGRKSLNELTEWAQAYGWVGGELRAQLRRSLTELERRRDVIDQNIQSLTKRLQL